MTPLFNLKDYEQLYEGEHCVLYDMRADVPHTAFVFWRGFYRLDNVFFEKDMKIVLNFIKEKAIRMLIADYSQSKIMTDDVISWFHEHWYPNAQKYGLRNEAVLPPESIFARITLNNMISSHKLGLVQATFTANFDEARQNAMNLAKKLWNIQEDSFSETPFATSTEDKLLNIIEMFAAMEQNSMAAAETVVEEQQITTAPTENANQELVEFNTLNDEHTDNMIPIVEAAQDELESIGHIMEEMVNAHQHLPTSESIVTLVDTTILPNEEIKAA